MNTDKNTTASMEEMKLEVSETESYSFVSDEEFLSVSRKLIEQNHAVYEELAK